jgi:hypothetical protein
MRKLEDRQMDLKLYQKLHSFESSDLLCPFGKLAWNPVRGGVIIGYPKRGG